MLRSRDRLDGLDVEAEPFQRPHNERSAPQLILETRVRLGASRARNHLTVGIDALGQGLDPVNRGTSLRQKLDPANVINAIRGLHRVPQRHAMVPERPRR
jgi:hypothetical protein